MIEWFEVWRVTRSGTFKHHTTCGTREATDLLVTRLNEERYPRYLFYVQPKGSNHGRTCSPTLKRILGEKIRRYLEDERAHIPRLQGLQLEEGEPRSLREGTSTRTEPNLRQQEAPAARSPCPRDGGGEGSEGSGG